MPDDYYINRYYTNFNRILRWIAFFMASFLPGIYVAIITYHFSMIPSLFVFRLAVSRAGVPLPTFIEVIVMMLAFQLIKEAGLRLPHPIGGAMSIVSALILGDAAVGAGIASRITIIVVAISTLSYFLIPKIYGAETVNRELAEKVRMTKNYFDGALECLKNELSEKMRNMFCTLDTAGM